jgi:membrane protein implicated in regulation of membrane protease activity
MTDETKFLLTSIFSILVPAIIFGNWTVESTTVFTISFVMIMFLLHHKIKDEKERNWISGVYSGLHGVAMASIGLLAFSTEINGTFIKTSFGFEFLIFFLSAFIFIISSRQYREEVRANYIKSFPDKKSMRRDMKIDQILNNK